MHIPGSDHTARIFLEPVLHSADSPGVSDTGIVFVRNRNGVGFSVFGPGGVGYNGSDTVITLAFADADHILQGHIRARLMVNIVLCPGEAVSGQGPPGIAHHNVGSAVGVFHGMPVFCGADDAPAAGIFFLFFFCPFQGEVAAGDTGKANVRYRGAGGIRPGAGGGGCHADFPDIVSIPKAIDTLVKSGPL